MLAAGSKLTSLQAALRVLERDRACRGADARPWLLAIGLVIAGDRPRGGAEIGRSWLPAVNELESLITKLGQSVLRLFESERGRRNTVRYSPVLDRV